MQLAAIPLVLAGANTAVRCYTGSGKTLAYLLPALTLAITRAEREWAAATRKTAGQAGTVQVCWGQRRVGRWSVGVTVRLSYGGHCDWHQAEAGPVWFSLVACTPCPALP